jgi:hypothetical protein
LNNEEKPATPATHLASYLPNYQNIGIIESTAKVPPGAQIIDISYSNWTSALVLIVHVFIVDESAMCWREL